MSFPLFSTLDKDLQPKDLTVKQLKDLKLAIDEMKSEQHELIYMLIRIFTETHDINSKSILPYGLTRQGHNIIFDLEKLPMRLRKILYKFSLLKN